MLKMTVGSNATYFETRVIQEHEPKTLSQAVMKDLWAASDENFQRFYFSVNAI